MSNVDALKKLAAAIVGIIADEVPGKTTADVIEYIAKYEAGEYLQPLTVTSVAGSSVGTTKITVSPARTSGNSYVYQVSPTAITAPEYLDDVSAYSEWNGSSNITAEDGHYIGIYEVNDEKKVVKFGQKTVTANLG